MSDDANAYPTRSRAQGVRRALLEQPLELFEQMQSKGRIQAVGLVLCGALTVLGWALLGATVSLFAVCIMCAVELQLLRDPALERAWLEHTTILAEKILGRLDSSSGGGGGGGDGSAKRARHSPRRGVPSPLPVAGVRRLVKTFPAISSRPTITSSSTSSTSSSSSSSSPTKRNSVAAGSEGINTPPKEQSAVHVLTPRNQRIAAIIDESKRSPGRTASSDSGDSVGYQNREDMVKEAAAAAVARRSSVIQSIVAITAADQHVDDRVNASRLESMALAGTTMLRVQGPRESSPSLKIDVATSLSHAETSPSKSTSSLSPVPSDSTPSPAPKIPWRDEPEITVASRRGSAELQASLASRRLGKELGSLSIPQGGGSSPVREFSPRSAVTARTFLKGGIALKRGGSSVGDESSVGSGGSVLSQPRWKN